jgi:hypothetical protein
MDVVVNVAIAFAGALVVGVLFLATIVLTVRFIVPFLIRVLGC